MDITIQEYIDRANSRLKELHSPAFVVNPEQFKWYEIQTKVMKVEE